MPDVDWYPTTGVEERIMYANIDAKIDGYAAKYPFLTRELLVKVHASCRTVIEAFDKIEYNRATSKQATVWFNDIMSNKTENTPAPSPPVYLPIELPDGAFVGIEKFMRNFRELFKSQFNYDRADGLDLMFERDRADDLASTEPQPDMTLSISTDGVVTVEWKKSGFDALEVQYRKAGAEFWVLADKSTERFIDFAPPVTTPNMPEKFEFRAVLLIKNKRVGKWSPVYPVTIG